jgi:hypothetical protein
LYYSPFISHEDAHITYSIYLFTISLAVDYNKDWNENVKYEHRFNGKTSFYSPEQEINYLYRKNWQDPKYKKDASLEYKMQFLVKKGFHDPVAMYFRNDYMNKYDECPDNVLDLYDRRNSNEGINSYLKDHLEIEVHLNGKGMKNIDHASSVKRKIMINNT